MKRFAIGVDLGGTNLKLGAIAEDGELLEHLELAADARKGPEDVVGSPVPGRPGAAGPLGRPLRSGRDRRGGGRHHEAPPGAGDCGSQLAGLDRVQRPRRDRREMDAPFTLENDANAAALGEKWMGVAREMEHLAFLTLGTGIGGGLVLNGRIWHGAKGMAAELGHINVRPEGRLCNCGTGVAWKPMHRPPRWSGAPPNWWTRGGPAQDWRDWRAGRRRSPPIGSTPWPGKAMHPPGRGFRKWRRPGNRHRQLDSHLRPGGGGAGRRSHRGLGRFSGVDVRGSAAALLRAAGRPAADSQIQPGQPGRNLRRRPSGISGWTLIAGNIALHFLLPSRE